MVLPRPAVIATLLFVCLAMIPAVCFQILGWLGRLEENFQGKRIPVSFGISIGASQCALLAGAKRLMPAHYSQALFYCVATGIFCLLGLLDDWIGDKQIKGLKGHFKAAFSGRITTGFLKAVGGLACACCCGYHLYPGSLQGMVISALTIALCANLFNLLDLRPGRSASLFLISAGILLAFAPQTRGYEPISVCVAATALASIPSYLLDSRARVMMGDAGSNLLGAGLGIGIAGLKNWQLTATTLLILIAVHIIAERRSLTTIIANSPVLSALDHLTGIRAKTSTMQKQEKRTDD